MEPSIDDIKSTVTTTLESTGILANIRAQLRKAVYETLNQHNPSTVTNHKLQLIYSDQCNQLCIELINDYLQFNQFDYTLSVFHQETQYKQNTTSNTIDKQQLQHKFNLPPDQSHSILQQLVQHSTINTNGQTVHTVNNTQHSPITKSSVPFAQRAAQLNLSNESIDTPPKHTHSTNSIPQQNTNLSRQSNRTGNGDTSSTVSPGKKSLLGKLPELGAGGANKLGALPPLTTLKPNTTTANIQSNHNLSANRHSNTVNNPSNHDDDEYVSDDSIAEELEISVDDTNENNEPNHNHTVAQPQQQLHTSNSNTMKPTVTHPTINNSNSKYHSNTIDAYSEDVSLNENPQLDDEFDYAESVEHSGF